MREHYIHELGLITDVMVQVLGKAASSLHQKKIPTAEPLLMPLVLWRLHSIKALARHIWIKSSQICCLSC